MASMKSPDDPRKDLLPGSASSPESTPDPTGGMTTDERRRRLIRGMAAAAPMVFTLHSGAARAAQSNYRCVTEIAPVTLQGNGVLHVEGNTSCTTSAQDNYQRIIGTTGFKITVESANSGVPAQPPIGTYWLYCYSPTTDANLFQDQSANYWRRGTGVNCNRFAYKGAVPGTSIDDCSESTLPYTAAATSVDVAVFVNDENGDVDVYPAAGKTAITCSCWSSFDPSRKNPVP